MSLESLRQTALPIMVLIVVMLGFGLAIRLESGVLLSIVVILPFLVGMWLVQNHRLRLTKKCLENYLQKSNRSNGKENSNAMPSL